LADADVDLGLGDVVDNPEENGKLKVMSLRNIGLTAPYAHNGYFLTLKALPISTTPAMSR
jgi:cytochrome c peroxidase